MTDNTIQKRQEEQKLLLLKQLKSTPIVQVACEKTGVGRATYYRWRKEDKEFLKESDIALGEGKSLVNDMAESQLLSAIRDRNLTAIIFWLKNHHKTYGTKIEVSGEIKTRDDPLTEEQQKVIAQALELAGSSNLSLNQ